ncbi:MAG: response regulator [Nanoarchaeota archaeon]|nr:response regulator [Nanoarchaeota archaeon]
MTIKSDKNIKVLLVEDQYHIQNSLEKLILKENFQCKSIATGDESIKIFEENHPDIIFMDIQLPKMNGFQATEKILSKNPFKIPVFQKISCKEKSYLEVEQHLGIVLNFLKI